MTRCNYVPLSSDVLDPLNPYLDALLNLDILCAEEGIFINIESEE